MSPTVGKLFGAIAKAQEMMQPVMKGKKNPFFKSMYADLGDCMQVVTGAFSPNGLAVVQVPMIKDGRQYLTTIIGHSSGEMIRGVYTLQPSKSDAQALGSAMTYARRYSISSMCGLATKDDDGNLASGRPAPTASRPRQQPQQTRPPVKPKQKEQPKPPEPQPDKPQAQTDPLTDKQRAFLFASLKGEKRIPDAKHFLHWCVRAVCRPASPLEACGVSTLTKGEGMKILDALTKQRDRLIGDYSGQTQNVKGGVQEGQEEPRKVTKRASKKTVSKRQPAAAPDDDRPAPQSAFSSGIDPDEIPF
jgi:hypothetical protein